MASSAYAADTEADGQRTQAIVRVTFDTNGTCQTVYAKAGDTIRAGDAIVAFAPVDAGETIRRARQDLSAAEETFRAARTNFLAVTALRDQGKASDAERDQAERAFNVASQRRQETLTALRSVHLEAQSRVIYSSCDGTVKSAVVSPGQVVHAGDVAAEILCNADASAAPASEAPSTP